MAIRSRLMASSVLISAVAAIGVSGAAFAQTSDSSAPIGQRTPQSAPGVSPSIAAPTNAPPINANGERAEGVQEVVVTGSRIRSPNLTSNSPMTVVGSNEIKLEGATNIESVLNQLPNVLADQTNTASNGASGTANINLRALGPQRTLVLIDGRRLGPGEPTSQPAPSPADVNFIPSALVERVDVVTGGASAVYGSDAIAGVVNFIMKKNFQGIQIDAQGSGYNHQNDNKFASEFLGSNTDVTVPRKPGDIGLDGIASNFSIILGANAPDDKGNVTAYVTYQNVQPVLQSTRDFSTCAVDGGPDGTGLPAPGYACTGSSNTPYGRFGSFQNNPNGTNSFVKYNGGLYSYDTSPLNYLQRNDDRYNAGFFAHYTVNPKVELYSDFMFMDDVTDAQIAPSGLFRGTGPYGGTNYTLNCNNPFLGATQVAALCPGVTPTPGAAGGTTVTLPLVGYRFASSPRIDDLRHTDYKIDVGARGDFAPGWSYDAYIQYGISLYTEEYKNDVSTSRVQNALDVVYQPGTTNPVCASTLAGTSKGCVPLNLFTANGSSFTPAALNYVLAPGLQEGNATEQVASFNITGDLGQYGVRSPFATDGVGIALGTEYRRESLVLNTDEEFQSGDLSGQGGATLPASGSYDVYELFGEARVPIASDKPFIKDLSLDVGYRYSDYSSVGNTDTYKGEFSYAPVQDIRFRGSYNHAVRAPSTEELFAPRNVNLQAYLDPCSSGTGGPLPSQAACALTGVTAAEYAATAAGGGIETCTLNQCSQELKGNPALRPEDSDSYSVGFVAQPRFIPGLTFSVDFFAIKVNHIIQAGYASGSTILTSCLAGSEAYCGLIDRDPATGILFGTNGYVNQENVNAGWLRTQGTDVTLSYRTRPSDWHAGIPDVGSLTFTLAGTYTGQLTSQPGQGAFDVGHYDCAGLFGSVCGQPVPHWRHSLRTTWSTPYKFDISLNWRYIGSVNEDSYSAQPLLNGSDSEGFPHIDAYNYFDLAVTWRVHDGYTLRAGVNNIADKDPPIVSQDLAAPPFGNGNTYPGIYDSLGRQFFVALTANF